MTALRTACFMSALAYAGGRPFVARSWTLTVQTLWILQRRWS